MKIYPLMIWTSLALAAGWSGVWVTSSWRMHAQIEDWFEARRAEGWQAEYADLTVRGFPSRLDATLTDVRLVDPERGTGWEGPFFQVLGLTYKPGHQILVWPDRHVVTLPSGPVTVDGSGMRASVIHTAEGVVLRANFEAETLNLQTPHRSLAFAGFRLALLELPGAAPELYRVGLGAEAVSGPRGPMVPGSGRGDGLQVQAEVLFDKPFDTGVLAEDRPQPREIDLRVGEYRFEGLDLKLAGRLDVADGGRAEGEVTVRAVNWRELLEQARAAGQIPDGLADTLEAGLSLAAGLKGRPETLDLPLRFDAGQVSLGLIPLGQAPRFVLP